MDSTEGLAEHTQLSNWRTHPFNTWSFVNVEALVPGGTIHRAGPVTSFDPTALLDLGAIKLDSGKSAAEAIADSHTDALVILDDGQLCNELYFGYNHRDTRHLLFSVTKSVTGLLAGILVDEGLVDPSRNVASYVPELLHSAWGEASVRQVLDMAVSVDFDEDYLTPDGLLAQYRVAMEWNPPTCFPFKGGLYSFLPLLKAGPAAPGSVLHYASPTADVLGWVLERASGEQIPELLSTRLWGKLGAQQDAWITIDAEGCSRTAGGLCATALDLARFGEMVRHKGTAQGKEVVPALWIEDILQSGNRETWQQSDLYSLFGSGHYRSQWYMPDQMPGAMIAIGIHGQWLFVDSKRQVTIAKLSSQPLPEDDQLNAQNLELCDKLAAALASRR